MSDFIHREYKTEATKQVSAQELFDHMFIEVYDRAEAMGRRLPTEEEVFRVFVARCRRAVLLGEAPPDFMDEVSEVKPLITRKRIEELRALDDELENFGKKLIIPVGAMPKNLKS